jgi:hypothetical protein
MGYERKKKDVQAIRLIETVYGPRGQVLAEDGDWLVIEGNNQFYMTNDEFQEEFQQKQEALTLPPIIIREKDYVPLPYPVPCRPPYRRYWWEDPCDGGYGYAWGSSEAADGLSYVAENSSSNSLLLSTDSTSNCVYEAR